MKLAHDRGQGSRRKLGGVWAKGRKALRGLFLYRIHYDLVMMAGGALESSFKSPDTSRWSLAYTQPHG